MITFGNPRECRKPGHVATPESSRSPARSLPRFSSASVVFVRVFLYLYRRPGLFVFSFFFLGGGGWIGGLLGLDAWKVLFFSVEDSLGELFCFE